ncbi:MAG: metalloregulator ArsR/SmtB family transcription factor [Halofilum sp. (in: g-proteobacteria)]|nr:metalloregulator ArsR/SmtB family transcription factor [Halofilum sp. (in: g-proteobacteria)]
MTASTAPALDPDRMARSAGDAARFLRAIGNDNRLMVLCRLVEGELTVGELQARVPLSQSALSQHLAVLRREGLVSTRRSAQNVYYTLADDRARRVLPLLYDMFCQHDG